MLNRRNFIKSAVLTAAGSLSAGSVFAFQSTDLEITHEQITVTEASRNLRIVAVSDIHGRSKYLPLTHLVEVINDLSPDVFILAGDIVDRRKDLDLISAYKSVIVKHAKLAVMGNWEHHVNHTAEKLEKRYLDIGARLLINEVYEIQGYHFAGIDDYLSGKPDYKIVAGASAGENPVIVISHCPKAFNHIESSLKNSVIVISGHTHGGQIAPLGKALVTPKGSGSYVHGWYHRGNARMYVMRGIGTSGLPLRVGARPELLVLDIEKST